MTLKVHDPEPQTVKERLQANLPEEILGAIQDEIEDAAEALVAAASRIIADYVSDGTDCPDDVDEFTDEIYELASAKVSELNIYI